MGTLGLDNPQVAALAERWGRAVDAASVPEPTLVPAWELIGHEGTFRLPGGRATYEAVMFNDATARSGRVRLARLDASPAGIRQVNRYVDPDTLVEVLADHDAVEEG